MGKATRWMGNEGAQPPDGTSGDVQEGSMIAQPRPTTHDTKEML